MDNKTFTKRYYIDRSKANTVKWQRGRKMNALPMWVADMDFKDDERVINKLKEFIEKGDYGYNNLPEDYYDVFISWHKKRNNVVYDKETIRRMAADEDLPVFDKPDSQEICFIEDNDHAGFIERYPGIEVPGPGNFVTKDGKVLGQHRGITHYTIGQRRGLGLPMGRYVYVTEIRPETNEVVIGEAEEVFSDSLCCNDLNFMALEDIPEGTSKRLFCKIRYRHEGQYCTVSRTGPDELSAVFEKPVRAVTAGQAAVFYEGDVICAGGTIERYR